MHTWVSVEPSLDNLRRMKVGQVHQRSLCSRMMVQIPIGGCDALRARSLISGFSAWNEFCEDMAPNKSLDGSTSFLNKMRRNPCNRKALKRRLPFLTWIPNYNQNMFIYDLLAGTTVGLTVIPQAIAYAAVAGLSLQVNPVNIIFSEF